MKKLVTLIIAALTVGGFAREVRAQESSSAQGLVGTWIVRVMPPPGAPAAPYLSLATYAAGGVLTVAPDPSLGAPTSIGQGVWTSVPGADGRTFSSTHAGFAYASPAGPVIFTFKIHSRITLVTRSLFEGTGQLEICNVSFGNCNATPGFADLTAIRMEVGP